MVVSVFNSSKGRITSPPLFKSRSPTSPSVKSDRSTTHSYRSFPFHLALEITSTSFTEQLQIVTSRGQLTHFSVSPTFFRSLHRSRCCQADRGSSVMATLPPPFVPNSDSFHVFDSPEVHAPHSPGLAPSKQFQPFTRMHP